MWKGVGLRAVGLALLGAMLELVFQIDLWWKLAGIFLAWTSVEVFVRLTIRSPNARILTELSLSGIIIILMIFQWIEPDRILERTYQYASTKVKSQFADYRIKDAVDYLAERSAPVKRIFTDFSQSRGKFIATIHLRYRNQNYRGKIVSLVASHTEELVYEYSRRYISVTTNKAALEYFYALVAGSARNNHQTETSCIGYLAGRANLREVILMQADGDVRYLVRDRAGKVISNAGAISGSRRELSSHLTDARRLVAAALDEVKPMLVANPNQEAGSRKQSGCEILSAMARRIGRLPPDKAGPIVKLILSNGLSIKSQIR